MRKKERLEDYEVFYMELPHADYMEDIEIQDEYESPNYDKPRGLSDSQVSEIAKDSLAAAQKQNGSQDSSPRHSADPNN